jgi:hypothetical protein
VANELPVNDHSVGGLYLARYKLPRRWCRPFTCDVTQMIYPWRTGRAVALPSGPFRSTLVFGIWRKKPLEDYNEDLEDEQWLGGGFLDTVTVEEISHWSAGPDEADEQEGPTLDDESEETPAAH